MLTRSRAKAAGQPIFVDDQWSDAYIQAKDEQIDAQQQATGGGDWSDSEDSEDDDDDDDDASDVWRSDDEANADSDDDDEQQQQAEEAAEKARKPLQSWIAGGGFAENVCWTVLSVLVAPLLLYAAALKRCVSYAKETRACMQLTDQACVPLSLCARRDTPWPLRSASMGGMLVKVLANLLVLGALALVGYGAGCSERAPAALHALLWRHLEINGAAECRVSFLDGWRECLALTAHGVETVSPRCARALAQGGVLAVVLLLASAFHRRWLKVLLLLSFAGYAALNAALELQAEQRAAVKIFALDPTFAFANESIFVRTGSAAHAGAGRCTHISVHLLLLTSTGRDRRAEPRAGRDRRVGAVLGRAARAEGAQVPQALPRAAPQRRRARHVRHGERVHPVLRRRDQQHGVERRSVRGVPMLRGHPTAREGPKERARVVAAS